MALLIHPLLSASLIPHTNALTNGQTRLETDSECQGKQWLSMCMWWCVYMNFPWLYPENGHYQIIVQYSMRLYINSSRELQERGNKAPVCRDCVCVQRSLYVASLQQPIFYLISSVTLQSAGTDQYGSVLLQDAILFSWQQSFSQVVHSQNSLLIAPCTPDCSRYMSWKTIVSLWYFHFPTSALALL